MNKTHGLFWTQFYNYSLNTGSCTHELCSVDTCEGVVRGHSYPLEYNSVKKKKKNLWGVTENLELDSATFILTVGFCSNWFNT